jgi:stalled ribosome rescue protein Dom34
MSSQVGLWIDHRRAFIVYLAGDETTSQTILSDIEKHVRASGGSRSSTPYGPQDIFAEDRVDRKFKHHLEQYYERVARAVGGIESVFIMGPGEAKDELKRHLQKSRQKPRPVIRVETTDKMTEAQIIAKVKQHFA